MIRKDLNLPRYRLKTGPQSLAFRGATCGYKLPKDMRKVADCRIFNKRLINMFLKLLSSFFFPSLDIISWACFRPLSRQLDPGDHLVMFSARLKPQRRKKKPISARERSSLDIQRKGYENQIGTFNLKALQRICRKTIRYMELNNDKLPIPELKFCFVLKISLVFVLKNKNTPRGRRDGYMQCKRSLHFCLGVIPTRLLSYSLLGPHAIVHI